MEHHHQWRRNNRRNRPYQLGGGAPSLGTMASVAVVAYGTYRLANWAWNSWYSQNEGDDERRREEGLLLQQQLEGVGDELLSSQSRMINHHHHHRLPQTPNQWRNRNRRMIRCRDETMKAMNGFLTTLKRHIEDRTSTSKESKSLKTLRSQRTATTTTTTEATTEATTTETEGDDHDHDEQQERNRRDIEKELWETIKVRSVTRMVATAYAHSILFLVITVQVNLLGGKLFEEQIITSQKQQQQQQEDDDGATIGTSASSDLRMEEYSSSHKLVLQRTYKYFFEQGISQLIDSVERTVRHVMQDWDVSDPSSLNITLDKFNQAIQEIRNLEEYGGRHRRQGQRRRLRCLLLRFLMPRSEQQEEEGDGLETNNNNLSTSPNTTTTNSSSFVEGGDDLAKWILDETWDLLESPVLLDAQRECLNCTFDKMRDEYWGKMFVESTPTTTNINNNGNDAAMAEGATTAATRPLAHVITRLKHTSKSFFKQQQQQQSSDVVDDDPFFLPLNAAASQRFIANSYCAEMETVPSVLELADVSFN